MELSSAYPDGEAMSGFSDTEMMSANPDSAIMSGYADA
jgi:hypothetical protein